ncbi:PepSY-like domain-containing protein [Parabacteroides chongii]|uniref:PepSY-like domain-containing protein n=1 Tax=Parabacteroides chongii TaxID=2685834 RepID=UPI00240D69EA|nr:PepSY-like domain-containing protein [Parabacteroides chongii]WFE82887.1 PepSY-like domain-containing protein [Parabacteroides chongii]
MRTKLSVLALAMCGLLAFTSCDDDDNNYLPDQTVTKAFDTKYPDAGKVEWETKSGYEVADFHISGNDAEAWFDNKGNWLMTKTEINFGLLPEAVRKDLRANEYADWKYTDFDKLERSNAATIYVIEAEQGEKEVDLYYAEDGTLIKVVNDTDDDNSHFQPTTIPQAITDAINEMYAGATIVDFDQEKNGFEVDILHNSIYKDVYFNAANEWISTEWDITEDKVPAIVMNALKASDYKNYRIEDIDQIEKPAGTFYLFELEQGDNDVEVTISAEGNIENVRKD